jgi:CRP-like cAMP-binding protein
MSMSSNTDTIWQNLKRVDFKTGDIIFEEGDRGFFFYIIQEGKIEVYKNLPHGGHKTLGVVDAGQPLGEFALITESLRSASARALTDGFAVEVSEDAYKRLLHELPEWALAVFQSLIRRLKDANELLTKDWDPPRDTDYVVDEVTGKINR